MGCLVVNQGPRPLVCGVGVVQGWEPLGWCLVFGRLRVDQGQKRLVCGLLCVQGQELLGCLGLVVGWWWFWGQRLQPLVGECIGIVWLLLFVQRLKPLDCCWMVLVLLCANSYAP